MQLTRFSVLLEIPNSLKTGKKGIQEGTSNCDTHFKTIGMEPKTVSFPVAQYCKYQTLKDKRQQTTILQT